MSMFPSILSCSIHPCLCCCVSCSTRSFGTLYYCSGSWTILLCRSFGRRIYKRRPHGSNSCHGHIVQCFSWISGRWLGCKNESLRRHVPSFWCLRVNITPRVYRHKGHVEILNQILPICLRYILQSRSCPVASFPMIASRSA